MGNHFPGVAGDPNNGCRYCRLGKRFGWLGQGVFHTHDETIPLYFQIDPLTFLGNDIQVDEEEIETANKAIHKFLRYSEIDLKKKSQFELVIALAKLSKYRIRIPLKISEETEMMIKFAKNGNFNETLKIMERYPGIVNYIPAHRAWGLIHQAAYFNN